MREFKRWAVFLFPMLAFAQFACESRTPSELAQEQFPEVSGFLSPIDLLTPGGLAEIAPDDLAAEINDLSTFEHDTPEAGEDDCFDKLYDKGLIAAAGTTLTVDYKVDSAEFTKCLNESFADDDSEAKILFVDGKVRFFAKIVALKSDLTKFNGMTFGKFSEDHLASDLPYNDDRASLVVNTEMTYTLQVKSAEGSFQVDARSVSATSKPDVSGCEIVKKDDINTFGPCSEFDVTKYSNFQKQGSIELDEADYENKYFRADYENLTGTKGKPFYASGKMSFVLNNWKGEMTYNGPEEKPTWKASGKVAGETVERAGEFTPAEE